MLLYKKGLFLLALLFLLLTPRSADCRDFVQEDSVKAAMLYNFMAFVEGWEGPLGKDQPLVLGVLGQDALQERLVEMAGSPGLRMKVTLLPLKNSRELAVRRDRLHVLYVAGSVRHLIPQILQQVSGRPILTVCDDEGFVEAGGIMNFVRENSRIRFDINLDAAETGRLKLSAKLFGLARRIIR